MSERLVYTERFRLHKALFTIFPVFVRLLPCSLKYMTTMLIELIFVRKNTFTDDPTKFFLPSLSQCRHAFDKQTFYLGDILSHFPLESSEAFSKSLVFRNSAGNNAAKMTIVRTRHFLCHLPVLVEEGQKRK